MSMPGRFTAGPLRVNPMTEKLDGKPIAEWDGAARLLCVRLDTLGDVLMTTPAIRALREARPGCHITLLTSSAGAAVAHLIPEIDKVIVYDAPWLKATPPRADSHLEYGMAEQLRRAAFDAAVIFTVYSQNPLPAAFLCYLAGVPLRLAHCRENPYQLLTHWVREPEPQHFVRHEVRRHLDLIATVGGRTEDERLSLQIPAGATERVRALLTGEGVQLDRPWLVIHPGASAPSRRYPAELYARAASMLAGEGGCQIIWTGRGTEAQLVAHIQAMMNAPSVSLVDRLGLGELAALLQLSPLLIANNTGPVHVAAAVGTPVVVLYALTNPQHTPRGVPHRVLNHDVPCKYCYSSLCPEQHHRCLRLVEPGRVMAAAVELLAEREARSTNVAQLPGRALAVTP